MSLIHQLFISPRRVLPLLAICIALAAPGCATSPLPASQRPTTWAQSIDHSGLPNFYKVSDTLYRGAQPTPDGLHELARMGVKTVVDARHDNSDQMVLNQCGVQCERIPMSPLATPHDANVIRFLRIATDPARTPVFVHCNHGSDRTGVLCAMYRVAVQGWTKDEAIREMTLGGMGFHGLYQQLIAYVRDADIDLIKREAGLVGVEGIAAIK